MTAKYRSVNRKDSWTPYISSLARNVYPHFFQILGKKGVHFRQVVKVNPFPIVNAFYHAAPNWFRIPNILGLNPDPHNKRVRGVFSGFHNCPVVLSFS